MNEDLQLPIDPPSQSAPPFRHAVAAVLLLTIAACATNPNPPPAREAGTQAPIERVPVEEAPPQVDEPLAATLALRKDAAAASAQDDHRSAIVYLERAIRLEPRNADLWTELSRAHLADGNAGAATQHVRKAIALAGQDPEQERAAWLQYADVLDYQGQAAEARSIRRRYFGGTG